MLNTATLSIRGQNKINYILDCRRESIPLM